MSEKTKIKSPKVVKPKNTKVKSDTPLAPKDDGEVNYFRGAWRELKRVRWPDRKATWSLTFAVILFSLFFAGLILGLDYIFEALFRKVII